MNSQSRPTLSLAARYYTDPAVFLAERYGVLATTWQFAGHVSQLENAGDYFSFEIAGESLFCIRTDSGDIKGFYNVCQHRAHQLVSGSGSTRLLVCPYHAWTYELSGELRAGPNIQAVKGFDKHSICLTNIRIEEFCGFLFANLDATAKPMDEWYPQVREELSAFVPGIEKLKSVERVEAAERCNWKVSVENYSECYHCQLNHKTFANGIVKANTYDIQPQGYCLRHTTECQNLEKMSYSVDVSANEYAGHYSSWFLWPTMSFQVYPGNILNTYHWHPQDHEHVLITRDWFAPADADIKMIRKLALQDRQTTVEEDIHLVESVQRGLNSRGYVPGPLVIDPESGVKSEHSIAVLQQWMRESVSL